MDERIIHLEKQLAHQEYTIQQLNDLMREQGDAIERLEKELHIIKAKIDDDDLIDPERTPADDRPPHY